MAEFELSFKWEGVDHVLARLRKLEAKMATATVRKAARRGMNLVRDSARARAAKIDDPKTSEAIFRNIVTQESRRGKRMGGILMRVGVRGGARTRRGVARQAGTTPHWRHVELGTEFASAQPFMRPALAANMGAIGDTVAEELRDELDKVSIVL